MFAGHVGAALAIGHAERRINVGVLVAAALLLDIALWTFVVVGWESVTIPAEFARTHQPEFTFPYSHGLLASILWSAAAGAVGYVGLPDSGGARWRVAVVLALAVFSHWMLDFLVHSPRLPLVGDDSVKLGLGLWEHMSVALIVETAIVAIGLWLFLNGSGLSRGRSIALTALCLLVAAFTVAGMTVAPPPPSAFAMAASSLVAIALVCALAAWLGRRPR